MRRLAAIVSVRPLSACAGLLLAAALAHPAAAQLFRRSAPPSAPVPCVLDKCLTGAEAQSAGAAPAGRGPLAPGAFDFYVLALSWSPGFCDAGGASKAREQCAPGAGLGFVVHGLWPQNDHGYPSDCDSTARSPTRAALDAARGLYPAMGLAIHEWRKHGTCTGLGPADYFGAVRRARDAVSIPDAFRQPTEPQTLPPRDIARAFVASNRGLRTDAMGVTCRGGGLSEVRICLTKDLRGFTACPEIARATCRSGTVDVLPVQ